MEWFSIINICFCYPIPIYKKQCWYTYYFWLHSYCNTFHFLSSITFTSWKIPSKLLWKHFNFRIFPMNSFHSWRLHDVSHHLYKLNRIQEFNQQKWIATALIIRAKSIKELLCESNFNLFQIRDVMDRSFIWFTWRAFHQSSALSIIDVLFGLIE